MRSFRLRVGSPGRQVTHVLPEASGLVVGRAKTDGALVLARHARPDGPFTVVRDAPRRVGSGLHSFITGAWAFIGRRVAAAPGGGAGSKVAVPAVVERCDYAFGREHGIWNWSRVARCPTWYGRGQCVTYLSARKVRSWDEVDATVRAWMHEMGRGRLQATHAAAVVAEAAETDGGDEEARAGTSDSDTVVVAKGTSAVEPGGTDGRDGRRGGKVLGLF